MKPNIRISRRKFGVFLVSMGTLHGCGGGGGSSSGGDLFEGPFFEFKPKPKITCTYPIEVTVRNSANSLPVAGATVRVFSFFLGDLIDTLTTDANGKVSTDKVPNTVISSGSCPTKSINIEVSATGFLTQIFRDFSLENRDALSPNLIAINLV